MQFEVTLGWPPRELSPNAKRRWSEEEDSFLSKNRSELSHSEIANKLNRSERAVRNRCWRLGIVDKLGWTEEEVAELVKSYSAARFNNDIDLNGLAAVFGRDKTNVCRKARKLGLTDNSRDDKPVEQRKIRKAKFASDEERRTHQSKTAKERIRTSGHPKGMYGKKHTPETKASISLSSASRWASMTHEAQAAQTERSLMAKVAKYGCIAPNVKRGSWAAGWREIGGVRKFYRSRWEANYARYLQWLKDGGHILGWAHEPKTFWFTGIKRGSVSYLPDFWVKETNGKDAFHEVKGWMDGRSKTKIDRMARYYPEVTLIVVDGRAYAEIKRKVSSLVPGWEE